MEADSELSSGKKQALKVLFSWLPALCVMAAIFAFSSLPSDKVPLPEFFSADKVAHVAVYGLLGMMLGWQKRFYDILQKRSDVEGSQTLRPFPTQARTGLAIKNGLIGFLFACSDEWHQTFVPGRMASLADLGADTLGLLLGLWFTWKPRGRARS